MKKENILNELVENQLKVVLEDKRLNYKDLTRIASKITTSIFDKKECCLWNGYVTNLNEPKKGRYINFYFNKKKQPLHRLIYNNFKGSLEKGEYLKFNCRNKGYCLNINHIEKIYNDIPINNNKKIINKNILPKSTIVSFN